MDLLCSADQTVTIDFVSYGDGGHYHYLLTYLPKPQPHLTVSTTGKTFLQPPEPHLPLAIPTPTPILLAEVLLTRNQLQRLVNLIRYYRLPHKGWSTQITSVALAWTKSGRILGSEYHKDESGQDSFLIDADLHDLRALKRTGGRWATLLEMPVLSLLRVAEQAEAAYKKGQKRVWLREPRREETWAAKELSYHRQTVQNQASAEKIARGLPGIAALSAHYQLSDFDHGNYMFLESLSKEGDALSMTLKPRRLARIDQFDWYIPLEHGKLKLTGEAFVRQARRLNDCVASLDWLDGWKQAAPGRTIEATLYGESFIELDTISGDPYALWKTAGLPGSPFAVLTMRRADYTYLSLAVAPQERRTLVVLHMLPRSEKEMTAHPLDSFGKAKATGGTVREPFLLDAQGHS
ncbi:hypothetical protein [Armatimonas sp.]|uniref:hypothetical protein n=1 Tax=Armatimonas sp. TaxID=1872638 RepID=UPI00286A72ED|nr:hypothetical protein [Armatimonas sp.]